MMYRVKDWTLIACLMIIAVCCYNAYRIKVQMEELQRRCDNLRTVAEGAQEAVLRDSLHLSVTHAQRIYKAEVANPTAALVKDAGERMSDVESVATVSSAVADTIILTDSVGEYHYHDTWATIDIKDTVVMYSVRDSLTTIVSTDYKHRFLWWRWGKRGYRVKVISHNPHSRVSYNEYLKILR